MNILSSRYSDDLVKNYWVNSQDIVIKTKPFNF